jgi:cyclophilin family peptidyl-prolyl cis-trans isomerase
VDLSDPTLFTSGNMSNSVITFNTSAGPINVQLLDTQAPQTVANFFDYINQGSYNNDIFHRLVADFVLQGGGFTFSTNPSNVTALKAGPTVPSEADDKNRPAVEGTIAMALSGNGITTDNNSATDEFFFNLADNSSTLSTTTNPKVGDFTIFGHVMTGADQRVINTLASIPVVPQTSPFDQIPLQNYSGTHFPSDTTAANYALINGVTVVRRTEQLNFSIVSNSNSSIVAATIQFGQLDLHPTGTGTGTASIVVQATDLFGNTAQVTFTVTVS